MYVDPLLLFCKCIYVAAMRQKGNSMNFMNNNTNPIIIGIDHGYGNIKTATVASRQALPLMTRSRLSRITFLFMKGNTTLLERNTRNLSLTK